MKLKDNSFSTPLVKGKKKEKPQKEFVKLISKPEKSAIPHKCVD